MSLSFAQLSVTSEPSSKVGNQIGRSRMISGKAESLIGSASRFRGVRILEIICAEFATFPGSSAGTSQCSGLATRMVLACGYC